MTDIVLSSTDYKGIHGDIVAILESSRRAAARSVNALMTATYWEVGRRVVEFEQGGENRAAYGQALLVRLSGDLTIDISVKHDNQLEPGALYLE
jgi:hypothetical protein